MTTREGTAGPDRPAGLRGARPAAGAARRGLPGAGGRAACARERCAGTTASSCTPIASTARTSRSSPASTRGSRRRCSSSGPDDPPLILVGNECCGTAGAAPLPMRRRAVPGLQPARPAARPVAAAGRDPGGGGDRARARGSGCSAGSRSRTGRGSTSPPISSDELRALVGSGGLVENANDLLDRPGRRAAGDQRRSTSSPRSSMPPPARREASGALLHGLRPGHDRGGGRRASSAGTGRRCRAT